ncbi:hypothetical protein SXIM_34710 [Streptomyces xiamenensis]|uniref:Uncharacterized protein n=1 Tax=Streptomyces xiamenensis TaxID=408015 RepID=A0A0F7FWC5_9ACTN|nr:hypothetical protein SXIM_34710 [Streptomyces xiamenensis]
MSPWRWCANGWQARGAHTPVVPGGTWLPGRTDAARRMVTGGFTAHRSHTSRRAVPSRPSLRVHTIDDDDGKGLTTSR